MGSAPSGSGGGGTLSGGKTMLAGTFLAEQTHSNPPSYTLVSVGALAEGSRNRVQAGPNGGSSGSRNGLLRKSRAEKSGPHCTKLAALEGFDSLLLKDEEASRPAKNSSGISTGRNKSKSMAENIGSDFVPSAKLGVAKQGEFDEGKLIVEDNGEAMRRSDNRKLGQSQKKTPLQSRGRVLVPLPHAKDDPVGGPACSSASEAEATETTQEVRQESRASSKKRSRPGKLSCLTPTSNDKSEKSEVFNRLYIASKPWAGETDTQLLEYLATRGGTPESSSRSFAGVTPVASPKAQVSSKLFSRPGDLSQQLSSRSWRSKYRNHRELFDDCLHRDPSPDIRMSPDVSREGKSVRIISSARGGRPLYSPQKLAAAQASREQSGRIREKIKEIIPIDEDPAKVFMEAEIGISSPLLSPIMPGQHRTWSVGT